MWNEIKRVGLFNWLWFVVYLKRNEFHPRLERNAYSPDQNGYLRCLKNRELAHQIDEAINELTLEQGGSRV